MVLEGERWQRPGQAELERKPRGLLRDGGKKRGNGWAVTKWGFEEQDEPRGGWLCAMNGTDTLHFVDPTGNIQVAFPLFWLLESSLF